MSCPHCGRDVAADLQECPECGVNFAKLARKTIGRAASPESKLGASAPRSIKIAAAFAALVALFFTAQFRSYLPMPQGWEDLRRWIFPLAFLDVALHEGGHAIFGLLGIDFLTIAGGTLVQLAFPAGIFVHFWRQESKAGMLAACFWLGLSMIGTAYYAADAKMQAVILITGMSGREMGGLHDWGQMLETLGLIRYCVGIGQLFFLLGCWLMAFAPIAGVAAWFDRP